MEVLAYSGEEEVLLAVPKIFCWSVARIVGCSLSLMTEIPEATLHTRVQQGMMQSSSSDSGAARKSGIKLIDDHCADTEKLDACTGREFDR